MTDTIDHVARAKAEKTILMITAHERLCEERQIADSAWRGFIALKLEAVNDNIKALYDRNWVFACGAIVLLLGVIGYLLDKHGI